MGTRESLATVLHFSRKAPHADPVDCRPCRFLGPGQAAGGEGKCGGSDRVHFFHHTQGERAVGPVLRARPLAFSQSRGCCFFSLCALQAFKELEVEVWDDPALSRQLPWLREDQEAARPVNLPPEVLARLEREAEEGGPVELPGKPPAVAPEEDSLRRPTHLIREFLASPRRACCVLDAFKKKA